METSGRHRRTRVGGPAAPVPTACEWTPEDAERLAREAGLDRLGDHHWKVIASCREEVARTGRVPTLQGIATLTGFDAAGLQKLFPGDAEALIARVAGLRTRLPGGTRR